MSDFTQAYPKPILDSYLEANLNFPQMSTAQTFAVGSTAFKLIEQGEYSWQRLKSDMADEAQLQQITEMTNRAHGNISVRLGDDPEEHPGMFVFPAQRVGDLIKATSVHVMRLTMDTAHTISPHEIPLYGGVAPWDVAKFMDDLQGQCRPEFMAVSGLFVSAANSLKDSRSVAIKRDLHRNLRDLHGNNTTTKHDTIPNLEQIPARIRRHVGDAIATDLARIETASGQQISGQTIDEFMRNGVSGIVI